MYRKVTAFTKDQEKRKGMTEQVSLFPFIEVITDKPESMSFPPSRAVGISPPISCT
jgi:hypothetical protein